LLSKIKEEGTMAFERFTKVGARRGSKLSIRKNGQIGFTLGAIDRHNLRKFTHAVLFFDRDSKLLGIRPTSDASEEGAYKIQMREGSAGFSAKSFLDHYGIDYSKTLKFDLRHDNEEDMLVADISRVCK
jgi:hypothetical protein